MLPSAAPAILLAAALDRQRSTASAPQEGMLFASGYLLVWSGFSLLATLLQWGFDQAGLLSETMAAGNRIMAGAVLVAVGAYEWTPLKNTCLAHCRSPIAFLVHREQGTRGYELRAATKPRPPLGRAGPARRGAQPARAPLRLVHRGLRHRRSQRSEAAAPRFDVSQPPARSWPGAPDRSVRNSTMGTNLPRAHSIAFPARHRERPQSAHPSRSRSLRRRSGN
jgi:hypothetical protein